MVSSRILLTLAGSASSTFYASRTCRYHVTNQTLKVLKPDIVTFDVEGDCNFRENGENHEDICRQCKEEDNKCAGQFVACSGCCQNVEKVKRTHQCDQIKRFLKVKNTVKLDCDERTVWNQDTPGNVKPAEDTTEKKDIMEFESSCKVSPQFPVPQLADYTPMKIMFDCSNCAESDVPDLLFQCCEEARLTLTRIDQDFKNAGIKPFIWAPGCEKSTLDNYDDLSERKIDEDIDSHIEETWCPPKKGVSPSDDICERRRLSGLGHKKVSPPGNSSRHLAAVCDWELPSDNPTELGEETGGHTDAAASLKSLLPLALAVSHLAFQVLV